jgi:ABC-type transport system substrate-binding protein
VTRKKLFNDVRVRKAVAMLTPVDDLIRLIYKEYAPQCVRMVNNVSPLKSEADRSLKPVAYDAARARQLLSEAGWSDSDNDGILDKNIEGVKTDLIADLNYFSTVSEWKMMALLIAEHYAKAGIKINPVGMELKVFLEKARAHDFDLLLGSWNGTSLPEDYTQLWHTSSWFTHGSNYSGFGNPQSDALIQQMKRELNDSVRSEYSKSLQQIIYGDQPYVFLYCSMRRNIIHKRFANQVIFSERPGILCNSLRLLSINKGITMIDDVNP